MLQACSATIRETLDPSKDSNEVGRRRGLPAHEIVTPINAVRPVKLAALKIIKRPARRLASFCSELDGYYRDGSKKLFSAVD
jgi:hypothetical protein